MLYNVSYNTPEIFAKIDREIGASFGFFERFKNGGIGSPKLFVTAASQEIDALFALDSYLNTCNIELRPNGIIVRFRSILETWALPIPFYKLTIYKGRPSEFSIYRDHHCIRVKADKPNVVRFFERIQEAKVNYLENSGRSFITG